jgi:hypothetical protein
MQVDTEFSPARREAQSNDEFHRWSNADFDGRGDGLSTHGSFQDEVLDDSPNQSEDQDHVNTHSCFA